MLAGRRPVARADDLTQRLARLERAAKELEERPQAEVLAALGRACARWRDPGDRERQAGEDALASHWGVPAPAIAEVLDAAFGAWSAKALMRWVELELGAGAALDGFVSIGGARRRARGPCLLAVIAARGVPTTAVGDLLTGLLLKSPVWLKPATGADDLAARFAATLAEVDPELGEAVEVSIWRAGSEVEAAVLAAADTVLATGGADTIVALRQKVGPETRLVVHGPRLSAAILTKEALGGGRRETIESLARDTAFAGQTGCLSPVIVYAEAQPHDFGRLIEEVREACEKRWPCAPRIEGSAAERAAWAEWTALAGIEAAAGQAGPTAGGPTEAWSVQMRLRPEPPSAPAIPRLLFLAPVESVEEVAELCASRRGTIACVGVAGPADRIDRLAPALAGAGVERVAPLGRMQRPPVTWRRDGRQTLADLVRWTDWEDGSSL